MSEASSAGMRRRLLWLIALVLAPTLAALALPGPAQARAERGILLGFADDPGADNLLFSPDAETRELWAKRTANTNAELIRLNLYWSQTVGDVEPVDPRNPADPAYDWTAIDRAVRAADDAGLTVLLTVLNAPLWAEGANRPSFEQARAGTWKPSASKFRDFAVALATRYSGSYSGLPRVRYYEAWNEPNLHLYINPQRKGEQDTSPAIYRDLLNGFYDGINSVSGSNVVLSAGTGPFGDETGARRMPPVEFWRGVFCLKGRKQLDFDKKSCPKKADRAHLDIFAHNSISEPGSGPTTPAVSPDNATAIDMHKLVDVIRAAEKHGTVLPKGKREVWSTELWFESKPPEPKGVKLQKHARYVAEALYVLWKQKVSAGIFLQVRDSPYDPSTPAVIGLQSGVYFLDGEAKPALDAAQFPFVAERLSGRKVRLWGKSPQSGRVTVERKAEQGYEKVMSTKVGAGDVFSKKVELAGKQELRAVIGDERSVSWPLGKG